MDAKEWKIVKQVVEAEGIDVPIRSHKIKGSVVELTLADGRHIRADLAPKTEKKAEAPPAEDGKKEESKPASKPAARSRSRKSSSSSAKAAPGAAAETEEPKPALEPDPGSQKDTSKSE